MQEPLVTIVISPRERFLFTEESLKSIYQYTDTPFKLIYVDGGSPEHIQAYLIKSAKEKDFKLIRVDHYLTANQARNIALKHVTTPFVAFVENDVVVSKGWLSSMLKCADETGCDVVSPVTCQDLPIHENIHHSGGDLEIKEEMKEGKVERILVEGHSHKQGIKYSSIESSLKREKIGYTEAHCFLVRSEILKKIQGFDDKLLSTKDFVDFSLSVRKAGGTIYLEPRSVITFMGHFTAPPLEPWEEDFFRLRWSDEWELNSLKYLIKKWNLTEGKYFKKRYSQLGWRRRVYIIQPKIKNIRPGKLRRIVEEAMVVVDRVHNRKVARHLIKNLETAQDHAR